MSLFKGLLVAVSVLSLAGCSTVSLPKPMGETVASVEPEQWEGTWLTSTMDTSISIKVTDAKKGILKAAWLDDMKMETLEFYLLESGEWMFGNVKDEENSSRFLWGRLKKEDSQIIVWFPDVEKIKDLVKAGSLPGTVGEDGDVALGDLKAEHVKLITSDDQGILFEWEEPLVLIRLSK